MFLKMAKIAGFWALGFLCAIVISFVMSVVVMYFVYAVPHSSSILWLARIAYMQVEGGSWYVGILGSCLIFFNEAYYKEFSWKRLLLRSMFWGLCVVFLTQLLPIVWVKYIPPAGGYNPLIAWPFRLVIQPIYFVILIISVILISRKLKWP